MDSCIGEIYTLLSNFTNVGRELCLFQFCRTLSVQGCTLRKQDICIPSKAKLEMLRVVPGRCGVLGGDDARLERRAGDRCV